MDHCAITSHGGLVEHNVGPCTIIIHPNWKPPKQLLGREIGLRPSLQISDCLLWVGGGIADLILSLHKTSI